MDKNKKYAINLTSLDQEKLSSAGIKSSDFLILTKNALPVSNSFIILTDAFDDNLIANSLIEPISKVIENINYDNADSVKKSSKQIQELIGKSEIPVQLKKEIIENYKILSGFTENSVNLMPAYKTHEIVTKMTLHKKMRAFGADSIIEVLKSIWQDFFSEENITHRHKNDFEGDLTLAVIVQKEVTAESSGMAFNFDPTDHNKSLILIEGVYGIWNDENSTPDIYKVSKKNIEILEKKINKQEKMVVRTREQKDNYQKIISVTQNWTESQKVDDNSIESISKAMLKIEEIFDGSITVSWAKEADKIFITDITKDDSHIEYKELMPHEDNDLQSRVEQELKDLSVKTPSEFRYKSTFTTIPTQNEKEGLKLALSGTGNQKGFAWGVAKIAKKQSDLLVENPKTILVISEKFNLDLSLLNETNASGVVIEGSDISLEIPTITHAYRPDEVIRENELITVDSDSGDVFIGAQHSDKKAESKASATAADQIIKLPQEELITIPTMNEIKTGIDTFLKLSDNLTLPDQLVNIDGGFIQNLNKVAEFAGKLSPKPVIVEIDASLSEDQLTEKLKFIHKLRNKDNFRNIWLSFSNIKNLDTVVAIKKILTSVRLRRSSSFFIFTTIDNVVSALGINKIMEIDVDGLIVDVRKLLASLYGEYSDSDLQSASFVRLLDTIFEDLNKAKVKNYFYAPFDKEFLKPLIKKGLNTLIIDPENILQEKEFIMQNEVKKLVRKKKRGRRIKN